MLWAKFLEFVLTKANESCFDPGTHTDMKSFTLLLDKNVCHYHRNIQNNHPAKANNGPIEFINFVQ